MMTYLMKVLVIIIFVLKLTRSERPLIKRFDKSEVFLCKSNKIELPSNVECRFKLPVANETRCVETTEIHVNHVDVFECRADGNRLLVSESLKQLEWSPGDGFPRNAFHETRLLNGHKIAVNGSKCYTFRFDFDKEVRIGFFVVKMWTEKWPLIVPRITPIFKYRTCVLKQISHHTRDNLATYSYSFVCDLEHQFDPKLEDSQEFRSLSIVVDPLSGVGLGLEALYIADIQSKIDAKC